MPLLRTDLQMALNDLHVTLLESADYFRDAAEFLGGGQNQSAGNFLESLADERYQLAERIEAAIRDTGDLPSVPDTDRETGNELWQKLEALMDDDKTAHILAQRLEAEEAIQQELESDAMDVFRSGYHKLYQAVVEHVQSAIARLQARLD
ncbi:MAG TPA: hypothetical protein VIC08_13095 [Cellvibrionaceae bacterium]